MRRVSGAPRTIARSAADASSTAAKVATIAAPVGKSNATETPNPARLATIPADQPMASAAPMRGENRNPITAGMIRNEKTSRTPARATELVTTTANVQ